MSEVKVLLVEDSPVDALVVKRAFDRLEPGKFELVHVASLAEALDAVKSVCFQAVLLDLGLPDSSGTESIRALLDQVPTCAVIVLSGVDKKSVESDGIRLGAQEFLCKKNVEPDEIIRVIRNAAMRKIHMMELVSEASSNSGPTGIDDLLSIIRESTAAITKDTNELLGTELSDHQSKLVVSVEKEARTTLTRVRNAAGVGQAATGEVVDDV